MYKNNTPKLFPSKNYKFLKQRYTLHKPFFVLAILVFFFFHESVKCSHFTSHSGAAATSTCRSGHDRPLGVSSAETFECSTKSCCGYRNAEHNLCDCHNFSSSFIHKTLL